MRKIYMLLLLIVSVYAGYPKNNTVLKNTLFANLHCSQVIKTDIYDTCYNYSERAPLATAYVVKKDTIDSNNIQLRYSWKEYDGIPYEYRQHNIDYYKSGYDRGHLAKDSWFDFNKTALRETYYLGANTVPMLAYFNRYIWSKIENRASKLVREKGDLYVVDILDYDTPNVKSMLNGNIGIPTNLYKIIYKYQPFYMECYKVNQFNYNKSSTYLDYKIDCTKVRIKRIRYIKLIY